MNQRKKKVVATVQPNELKTLEEPSSGVSPLVQMFATGEVPIEKLDQLMTLNERWEKNEAKKSYNKAMADFRLRCPDIVKDSVVDFTSTKGRTHYKHASLSGAMSQIKDILGELGLNPSWDIDDKTDPQMIRITCFITHRDGHSESTSMAGPPDQSGNKNILQARSSTCLLYTSPSPRDRG